jgi:hypothetical protein
MPTAKLEWRKALYKTHRGTDCYAEAPEGRWFIKRSGQTGRTACYSVYLDGVRHTKERLESVGGAKGYVRLYREKLGH